MSVSLWLAALAGGIVPLLWVSIIQRVMTFTADDQTIDGQILGASLITLFAYVGGVLLASAVSWLSWRKSDWFNRLWNVGVAASFGVCAYIAWAYNLISFNKSFRSDVCRVGKESVSRCKYRWS